MKSMHDENERKPSAGMQSIACSVDIDTRNLYFKCNNVCIAHSAKVLRHHLSNCDYSEGFFCMPFSTLPNCLVLFSCHFNVSVIPIKFRYTNIYFMDMWDWVSGLDLSFALLRSILRAHQINISIYIYTHTKPQITRPVVWTNVSKLGWIICHSHALHIILFLFFFIGKSSKIVSFLFIFVCSLKQKAVIYQKTKPKQQKRE